jgi:hypothetical protein
MTPPDDADLLGLLYRCLPGQACPTERVAGDGYLLAGRGIMEGKQ